MGRSVYFLSIVLTWSLVRAVWAADRTGEEIDIVVSTAADVSELVLALMHDGPVQVSVDWRGRVELTQTLTLGNGSSLAITGSDEAAIDGGGTVRILEASGGTTLNLLNISLDNGWAADWGGALYANESSIRIDGCSFSGNTATIGGGEFIRYRIMRMARCALTTWQVNRVDGGIMAGVDQSLVSAEYILYNFLERHIQCSHRLKRIIACSLRPRRPLLLTVACTEIGNPLNQSTFMALKTSSSKGGTIEMFTSGQSPKFVVSHYKLILGRHTAQINGSRDPNS